ncbi:hypothetical protein GCM10010094_20080 [Streptomyces flaveus]|uniref:Uncharacterized protein n=1 Tax=Streptomyces flaveus TaxID=66370 RepID=A0A917VBK7_9ACTN|nr:hypothetical protein GCM10010094_20080 [Streptomyces flaveus]
MEAHALDAVLLNRFNPSHRLDTVIDAGPYLRSGTNTIEVRVATTLANAVNPAAGHRYGLLGSDGEVTITPYTRAVVARSTAGRRSNRR